MIFKLYIKDLSIFSDNFSIFMRKSKDLHNHSNSLSQTLQLLKIYKKKHYFFGTWTYSIQKISKFLKCLMKQITLQRFPIDFFKY